MYRRYYSIEGKLRNSDFMKSVNGVLCDEEGQVFVNRSLGNASVKNTIAKMFLNQNA